MVSVCLIWQECFVSHVLRVPYMTCAKLQCRLFLFFWAVFCLFPCLVFSSGSPKTKFVAYMAVTALSRGTLQLILLPNSAPNISTSFSLTNKLFQIEFRKLIGCTRFYLGDQSWGVNKNALDTWKYDRSHFYKVIHDTKPGLGFLTQTLPSELTICCLMVFQVSHEMSKSARGRQLILVKGVFFLGDQHEKLCLSP